MTHLLHFAIYPVQSFIGQSRRTRDLWSSSFLLSWLTGVAMAKVLDGGGRILIPSVQDGDTITDDLLRAVRGRPDQAPFIGTLPNRFKAQVPDGFDPTDCAKAVQAKWEHLAGLIKTRFLPLEVLRREELLYIPRKKQNNPNAQGKSLTETLWDQQVARFWDIQWVKGEEPADGSDARWLNLRKHWRQHVQPDQQDAGDACTLMPGWIELSGHVRSLHKGPQDAFWQAVRGYIPTVHRGEGPRNPGPGHLNLRDDERLCAIAFIKRLWPKLHPTDIRQVLGWVPGRIAQSAGNWPSTACMAALPWVEQVYVAGDDAQRGRCDAYVESLKRARVPGRDERTTEGLFSETLNRVQDIAPRPYFCTLDGQLFFEDGLQAAATEKLLQPGLVADLQKELAAIAPGSKASPFYAVLRMDGDSVGDLIKGQASAVALALQDFAARVRQEVDTNRHGATLYAGGDDVLALLPMDRALGCAQALQQHYTQAMAQQGVGGTISAAIVFAHFHLPLSFVMAESSRLLDDVAKTGNGRDSLAVAVHKPGGLHLQWAARWAADPATVPPGLTPLATLQELARRFNPGHGAPRHNLPLSSGFLYRIRDRWSDLTSPNPDGQPVLQFPQTHVEQLWVADLLANRDLGEVNDAARDQARLLASQLFTISRDNRNPANAREILLSEDGGLLVRFLATQGVRP